MDASREKRGPYRPSQDDPQLRLGGLVGVGGGGGGGGEGPRVTENVTFSILKMA